MKGIFSILLRLYDAARDKKILERWRLDSNKANEASQSGAILKVINGYQGQGVDTVVALSKDKRILVSLTGTFSIILDPLIKNPTAGRLETIEALLLATRASEIAAQKVGARTAFIAVPEDLEDYRDIVVKAGFVETAQGCKIYRHDFSPEEEVASIPPEPVTSAA